MNVLIITQWFDPEPNNMKGLAFAKRIKEKGHHVEVLTGLPNYPNGILYKGYKKSLYQKEWMEGVLIHRVLLYPSHDAHVIKRMLNYISFAFFASILGPFKIKGRFDVIYVYHPPITSMLPALLLKRIKNAKLLLDVNDLWPDTFRTVGMMNKKWFLYFVDKWVKYCYKKADKINVLSVGMKNILILREVPFEKIEVISVWCNETNMSDKINQDFLEKHKLHNTKLAIYAGAMGKAQHLETIIEAAKMLDEEGIQVKVLLIGNGTCLAALRSLAANYQLSNLLFVPVLSPLQLTQILNGSDILLIHLKKEPLFSITIPSKIPYYLNIGKPIVAGLEGDAAELLKQSKSAKIYKSEDASGIARGIKEVLNMTIEEQREMGLRGKKFYQEKLSFYVLTDKFIQVMEGLSKNK